MAMWEILMALMVLEAGVSPCYILSNCSLSLLIDGSALATIWIAGLFVGIFVYLDEHYASISSCKDVGITILLPLRRSPF